MLEEIAFGFNIIKIAFNWDARLRIVVLSFEKNWKYIWL